MDPTRDPTTAGEDYQNYLRRAAAAGAGRTRLAPDHCARLMDEYTRLLRSTDPADVQLDEWKRFEELRFLLVIDDDED